MKTWILLFCLFLGSCSNRQTQSSDHENFYRIDFRPLVKNEAQEIGLNEWATNPRYVQLEPTTSFGSNPSKGSYWTMKNC